MLPSWVVNGRPITVRVAGRSITVPTLPLMILSLILVYLVHELRAGQHRGGSVSPDRDATIWSLERTTSPFLVPPHDFPRPPALKLPHGPSTPAPESPPPKRQGMRVPDAVHYVFGLKPVPEGRQPDELPYYAYLGMRSALVNLQPKKMFFHYKHLPTGPWWDLIRPHLTLIETDVPEEVFGRKVVHYAHKADLLRLWAMKRTGGIYLDIDMFVVKPFDDLMYYPTTLGMESATDSSRSTLEPQGLCNAVIVAEPNAPFIDRWLAAYDTFDDDDWAYHSVAKPWELARLHPEEIQVMNRTAFFWPMWHGNEVEKVHELDEYDFIGTGQYAYHAWESLAMGFLEHLSPQSIRDEDTSFHRLVRPFIGPEDDRVFAELKQKKNLAA